MIQAMRAIEAQFEDGLLKPSQPLPLRQGERVNLLVLRKPDPNRWDLKRLAGNAEEDIELANAGLDQWSRSVDMEDKA